MSRWSPTFTTAAAALSSPGTYPIAMVPIALGIRGPAPAGLDVASESGLKKAMLERGMSAEEIRMVMDLRYKGAPSSCKQPAYEEV